jgi:cytochrome c-type biogenesis protein CcmH/NrfG
MITWAVAGLIIAVVVCVSLIFGGLIGSFCVVVSLSHARKRAEQEDAKKFSDEVDAFISRVEAQVGHKGERV